MEVMFVFMLLQYSNSEIINIVARNPKYVNQIPKSKPPTARV